MRLGVVMPSWSGGLDGTDPTWADVVALALAAEEAGFESAWVADTLLVADEQAGLLECWSLLAGLADATSRIRLGSLVSAITFRNPALTAKIAQTVDEMSDHRLVLGLGAGGNPRQHRAFGFRRNDRFDRLEEAIPIIRSLLAGDVTSSEGRFYYTHECALLPRADRREPMALLLGGTSRRTIDLTARCADAWNAWLAYGDNSPAALRPHLDELASACARHDRRPADVEKTVSLGVRLHGAPLVVGSRDMGADAIVGDVDAIGERLCAFREIGVDLVQLTFAPATRNTIAELGRLNDTFGRSNR
jgi:alkanesulfonate monooxygenase SsuD/methylene tetrahydromethanopterin reductase-like flavin-dependent oxidoreductase (luciferase family)